MVPKFSCRRKKQQIRYRKDTRHVSMGTYVIQCCVSVSCYVSNKEKKVYGPWGVRHDFRSEIVPHASTTTENSLHTTLMWKCFRSIVITACVLYIYIYTYIYTYIYICIRQWFKRLFGCKQHGTFAYGYLTNLLVIKRARLAHFCIRWLVF